MSSPVSRCGAKGLLLGASLVALATVVGTPGLVEAQPADHFVGTYRYSKSFAHGRSAVHAAFNKGIDSITPIMRPLIRRRVFRNELMVSRFSISQTPQELIFRAETPRSWTWGMPQGVTERVVTPVGAKANMVHRVLGDRYIQQFSGRLVKQSSVYRLSADGRQIRVDTNIQISIAEEPIRFSLLYVRAAG